MLSSHAAITYHFCTKVFDMATGSEVIFATGARGRIINETHNKYSREGYCGGGSRGKGETNPQFRTRRGTRRVKLKAHRRCTAPRTSARSSRPSSSTLRRRSRPTNISTPRRWLAFRACLAGSATPWRGVQPDLASMSDADKRARCWHSFMLAWLATNLVSLASLELPRVPTSIAGGDNSGLDARSWVSTIY